jgi:hypothetical protein
VFKVSPLGSYFAGIATVVIALSAGFAGGAHVGSSWGRIERLPAATTHESRPILEVQRREIPLVQAVALDPTDEQATAAKGKADTARANKAAAARKDADERRKIARAERRKNAERNRQIALAARKMQASAKREELKASQSLSSSLELAPQVHSQTPAGQDGAAGSQAP